MRRSRAIQKWKPCVFLTYKSKDSDVFVSTKVNFLAKIKSNFKGLKTYWLRWGDQEQSKSENLVFFWLFNQTLWPFLCQRESPLFTSWFFLIPVGLKDYRLVCIWTETTTHGIFVCIHFLVTTRGEFKAFKRFLGGLGCWGQWGFMKCPLGSGFSLFSKV